MLVLRNFHWSFFPCRAQSTWRTGGVAFSHSQAPSPTSLILQGHEHIPKGHFGKLSALEEQDFTTHFFQNNSAGATRGEISPQTLPWTDSLFPKKGKQRREVSPFDYTAPFLSPLSQGGLWAAAANTLPTMAAFKLFPGATGKQGKH